MELTRREALLELTLSGKDELMGQGSGHEVVDFRFLRGVGISHKAGSWPWASGEHPLACCGICLEESQGRLSWR